MRLDDLDTYPVRVLMRTRFRRVEHRDAVLLHGPAGWGEFSPFPEYGPEVAARWLAAALEAAAASWPPPRRSRIPVNVTVPAVPPGQAARMVQDSGCSVAKVKVAEPGQRFADDVARVEAVRTVLGTEGRIRIDVNGAWTVDEAEERIVRLDEYDLEYVEQPCASVAELAELRRRVPVPVAADESVRTADDPLAVVEAGAADLLVLKVQPLGGVRSVLDLAEAGGLPVVVSSALETSVGLAAGLAAAAALPQLPYACGLATGSLLAADVVADPLLPSGGMIELRRPEPDPERLAALRPPPGVVDDLYRRLASAASVLERSRSTDPEPGPR